MESISGLPAHPLLVHAPVVLIPLCALVSVVLVFVPRLRLQLGPWLAGAAVVTLIATQLAVSSGGAFDELLDGAADTERHEQLGLITRNLMVAFALSSVATFALDRRAAAGSPGRLGRAGWVAMAIATLSVVTATVFVVLTGEEGARLVWDGVLMGRMF